MAEMEICATEGKYGFIELTLCSAEPTATKRRELYAPPLWSCPCAKETLVSLYGYSCKKNSNESCEL